MENKKNHFLDEVEENLMGIATGISMLLILLSFCAQFFASPETVTAINQTSYYAYVLIVAVALSLSARSNIYYRVPLLEKHLPDVGRKILKVIQEAIGMIILLVVMVVYIQATREMVAAGTMDEKAPFLPVAFVYIVMTLGLIAANIRNIARLVKGGK